MVLIKLNITERLCGVVRLNLELTLLYLKPKKESFVFTPSSILIIKINTKQIATFIHFKSIDLTENGIQRNLKSSKKSESTQFA